MSLSPTISATKPATWSADCARRADRLGVGRRWRLAMRLHQARDDSASMVRARCASRSLASLLRGHQAGEHRHAAVHLHPAVSQRSREPPSTGRFTLHRCLLSLLVPQHRSAVQGSRWHPAALARSIPKRSGSPSALRIACTARRARRRRRPGRLRLYSGRRWRQNRRIGVSTIAAGAETTSSQPLRARRTRSDRPDGAMIDAARKCQCQYTSISIDTFRAQALVLVPWIGRKARGGRRSGRQGAARARRCTRPESASAATPRVWTLVQGILAPVQFLVFLVSLALVLRYLATGEGYAAADALGRGQDAGALHDHDHRLRSGRRWSSAVPVRAGLLLGRRVQHAGAGAAHGLSGGAVRRRARRRAARCCSRSPPMPPTSSTPRSSC